jgi:CheY-like chemotaxis protein
MTERKILVVDDEETIRDMLEMAFSRFGYTVRLAENGERALEILKKEKIQVMFLDINMPGMDGLELCRRIREEYPISIIHAITGYGSLFELSDCRQVGFDDYFRKPMDLEVLHRAAEDAFNKIDMWNISELG